MKNPREYLFEKTNNKIAPLVPHQRLHGQPPLSGGCFQPARTLEVNVNVIQKTSLPRPNPQLLFHPQPPMSLVPFTNN